LHCTSQYGARRENAPVKAFTATIGQSYWLPVTFSSRLPSHVTIIIVVIKGDEILIMRRVVEVVRCTKRLKLG